MQIGIRDIPEYLTLCLQINIDSVDTPTAGYMVEKEEHYEKTT